MRGKKRKKERKKERRREREAGGINSELAAGRHRSEESACARETMNGSAHMFNNNITGEATSISNLSPNRPVKGHPLPAA